MEHLKVEDYALYFVPTNEKYEELPDKKEYFNPMREHFEVDLGPDFGMFRTEAQEKFQNGVQLVCEHLAGSTSFLLGAGAAGCEGCNQKSLCTGLSSDASNGVVRYYLNAWMSSVNAPVYVAPSNVKKLPKTENKIRKLN